MGNNGATGNDDVESWPAQSTAHVLRGMEDGYTFGSTVEIIEVMSAKFWGEDSFGVVILKWEVTSGKGVEGYKIYRKEGEDYVEIWEGSGVRFVDENIKSGAGFYCYRLYGITFYGEVLLDLVKVWKRKYPTKFSFKIGKNNPFRDKILFHYAIKTKVYTELKVYNIVGQEMASFIKKELNPGFYVLE